MCTVAAFLLNWPRRRGAGALRGTEARAAQAGRHDVLGPRDGDSAGLSSALAKVEETRASRSEQNPPHRTRSAGAAAATDHAVPSSGAFLAARGFGQRECRQGGEVPF